MNKLLLSALTMLTVSASVATAAVPAAKTHRAPAGAPIVLEPTDVTATGFTANWEALPGADGYAVMVFTKTTIDEPGEYTVLSEDFSLITAGSIIEPVWDDNAYVDLSSEEYDWVWTPNWTAGPYPSYAGGKIGGVIYTPYIDLTNNGGKYTVEIGVVGDKGGEYLVRSIGTGDEIRKTAILEESGYNLLRFEFENGCHDTFLVFVDNGFPSDPTGETTLDKYLYLDDVKITQHLEAGDEMLQLVDINEAVDAPATSCKFDPMRFLYGATTVYYDVMGAYLDYPDPDDPWYYESTYSPYSDLQRVDLLVSGIDNITTDTQAPATTPAEEIYNIAGQRISTPRADLPAGIYIVRNGDKATKIAVK